MVTIRDTITINLCVLNMFLGFGFGSKDCKKSLIENPNITMTKLGLHKGILVDTGILVDFFHRTIELGK